MDIDTATAVLQYAINTMAPLYQVEGTVRRFAVVAAEMDKDAAEKADPPGIYFSRISFYCNTNLPIWMDVFRAMADELERKIAEGKEDA